MIVIPEYIEVSGAQKARLLPKTDGLKDCYIDSRLNGECTLSFLLPLPSEKWPALVAECRIRAGGREFMILRPDAIDLERDDQGLVMGKVVAVESWMVELDKIYPTISNDPNNTDPPGLSVSIISGGAPAGGYLAGSAGSALSYLLDGTGWILDVCDVEGNHDLEDEKLSTLALVRRVQETWGGILVWDSWNKKVSLREEVKWQVYTGFQIRHAKNLRHITKTVNNDLITRLYVFGENDLDIGSVNNGVKYLENFSYTNKVYEGVFRDQNIADPQGLKTAAAKTLAKVCQPRYTYRTEIADLRVLSEYSHENFGLGHLVDVIDEDVQTNVRQRIVRHKYNVFQPWECELEIGEPEERLEISLAESFEVSERIRKVVLPNPSFANFMKGVIDTYSTIINSAGGKLIWQGDRIDAIEIDPSGAETGKIVRLTPGGLGISVDNGQTFRTAVTGAGIVADVITAGKLNAGVVHVGPETTFADGYDPTQIQSGDYTQTIIDGGLITTGSVRLKDGAGVVKAGVQATGNGDESIRFWAGHSTPISAPFKVTQGGVLVATGAIISGNITMAGGSISWGSVTAPDYSQIAGTKPPANADNTLGAIGSNRLTHITSTGVYTGTVAANQIVAGTITGFTVSGAVITGSSIIGGTININSGRFSVSSDGSMYAAGGGFYVPSNADGIYVSYGGAARWKYDDSNYSLQSLNHFILFFGGSSKFSVSSAGNMAATGTKSAVVDTENYGKRKLYAVEAADNRFCTVIEKTLSAGAHWIDLEPMFAETINGYTIMPIPQGRGEASILAVDAKRFQVQVVGMPDIPVAFFVWGKRKGYEDIYMEEFTAPQEEGGERVYD